MAQPQPAYAGPLAKMDSTVPVVHCPQCAVELDLDAEDVGHKVECPACLRAFVVTLPAQPVEPGVEPEAVPPPLPPVPQAPSNEVTLKCIGCKGDVTVYSEDLGFPVQCPICRTVFSARDPNEIRQASVARRVSEREYESRRDYKRPNRRTRRERLEIDDNDPEEMTRQAKRDLATPGGGLQALGWVDVTFGLLSIIIGILFAFAIYGNGNGPGPGANPEFLLWGNIGPGVSGIIMGAVKIFGGKSMKDVRNRGLALGACFAGCLPLNVGVCLIFFMFPAYITGLVFAIIGFVGLMKPNVKKAYEANRPDGDVDGM